MKSLTSKLLTRIQNPKVIIATVSGIILVCANTGLITVEHANHINDILNTVLSLIVGLGVFANPESHVLPVVPDVAPVVNVVPVVQPVAPAVAPVAPVATPLPDGQSTPLTPPPFYTGAV